MEGGELDRSLKKKRAKGGGGCVYKKYHFSRERLVAANSLTGFAWTTSWCWIHEDICTVKHEISMPLMILTVTYCLKQVKGETIATVMMSTILLMKIVGDFMTNRNFILHCHFLKYSCIFQLELHVKYWCIVYSLTRKGILPTRSDLVLQHT
jgi:hypothetical protein